MPGNGLSCLKVRHTALCRNPKLTIAGIVSVLVAFLGFWLIPNWPNDTGTYFFTPEESQMAQYRQLVSAGGISESDEGGYWSGVIMAVKDPFTWMFAGIHFFLIVAQSFKDFFPSVSLVPKLKIGSANKSRLSKL